MTRHSLTDRDLLARTASCAVCGPVAIRQVGKDNWICAVKKAESAAAWRAANPEKQRASRHKPSVHHLTSEDHDTRRGVCPVDGDVDIARKGRGWMCKVRMDELGWTEDENPADKCVLCGYWHTTARPVVDGVCLFCSDPTAEAHASFPLPLSQEDRRQVGLAGQEVEPEDDDGSEPGLIGGWFALDQEGFDDLATDGWDTVDYGTKVIGPPVDKDSPWYQDVVQQRVLAKKARERRWA